MIIRRKKVLIVASWMFLASCSPSVPSEEKGVGQVSASDSVLLEDTITPGIHKPIPASESSTFGAITIAVDESIRPIIEAQIDAFEFTYPTTSIRALYLPGEEAIARMIASDSIRMAITSRRLFADEEALLAKRRINPKYAHVFSDGVALVAHPALGVPQLSEAQLLGIVQGNLTSWKDVDPTLPERSIELIFDHGSSSILQEIQREVVGGEPIAAQIYALSSSPEVLDHVATHPGALGFVGFSWLSDRDRAQVKIWEENLIFVRLEKSKAPGIPCAFTQAFFPPAQSFIHQGCYPLNRNIYTILRETTHGLGTGFVSFLDGHIGQKIIHKSGLVAVHGVGRDMILPPKPDEYKDPSAKMLTPP